MRLQLTRHDSNNDKIAEAYLEPSQTPIMEFIWENKLIAA